MLKKIIIVSYCALAILLMSFTPKTSTVVDKVEFQNPTEVTWKLLGQIDFIKKKNPHYGEVMYPMVNGTLKALQGKKIKASGFIVPIDSKSYALSKNVFAQCFFCGNAGPETIMGIKFKGSTPRLKTDTYVTMEGTFRYNADDIDDWIYHIENAVITHQK
ncbi:hypothetical protein H1R17_01330 [Flavobacterium sp. xlx-214]|uniref:hypothetical protein n=1 Tax=unclassified Flavobacterium TaxID=196869 RepID=UPI0013D24A32|nr:MULTISPECIES: hypothetical protein [unclassified Flavobacterium]MBA5792662.1 hypothetical protein [Flavobacterium sp. xlx-221]QMI83810.1 hypothetical protein H1R17_01330 [Flavobacterium sp. xlx-214]